MTDCVLTLQVDGHPSLACKISFAAPQFLRTLKPVSRTLSPFSEVSANNVGLGDLAIDRITVFRLELQVFAWMVLILWLNAYCLPRLSYALWAYAAQEQAQQ